jgi:hypothetical protein
MGQYAKGLDTTLENRKLRRTLALHRAACAVKSQFGKGPLRKRGMHLERSFEHVLREGGLRGAMLQNRKSH